MIAKPLLYHANSFGRYCEHTSTSVVMRIM